MTDAHPYQEWNGRQCGVCGAPKVPDGPTTTALHVELGLPARADRWSDQCEAHVDGWTCTAASGHEEGWHAAYASPHASSPIAIWPVAASAPAANSAQEV